MIVIRQGDAYPIPLHLCHPGEILTPEQIQDMEICVGHQIRRLYSRGEVIYDPIDRMWLLRLSQWDTLRLERGVYEIQARIKYPSIPGDGEDVRTIWLDNELTVLPGTSKEVL